LIGKPSCDVKSGLELSQIFSFEPHTIYICSVDPRFAFFRTVAKFLAWISQFAASLSLESAGALLVSDLFHRHGFKINPQ
jgi:hypothetical protein